MALLVDTMSSSSQSIAPDRTAPILTSAPEVSGLPIYDLHIGLHISSFLLPKWIQDMLIHSELAIRQRFFASPLDLFDARQESVFCLLRKLPISPASSDGALICHFLCLLLFLPFSSLICLSLKSLTLSGIFDVAVFFSNPPCFNK